MLRRILVLALAGACAVAGAQNIPDPLNDWSEADAPPPPPLRTQGLIPIDVPGSSLRFGIDPGSITIGPDRVVRYVVVASSSTGAVNGIYEGIRCGTGQVKVFARHNPGSGWVQSRESDWQDIYRMANSRYSLAIARSGACQENAPNVSAAQIILDLKATPDRRFQGGGANR